MYIFIIMFFTVVKFEIKFKEGYTDEYLYFLKKLLPDDIYKRNSIMEKYIPIDVTENCDQTKEITWGSYSDITNVFIELQDYSNLFIVFNGTVCGNPPYLFVEFMNKQEFIEFCGYSYNFQDHCSKEKTELFFQSDDLNIRSRFKNCFNIKMLLTYECKEGYDFDIFLIFDYGYILQNRLTNYSCLSTETKIFYENYDKYIDINKTITNNICSIELIFDSNKYNDPFFWTFDEILHIQNSINQTYKYINSQIIFESTKVII